MSLHPTTIIQTTASITTQSPAIIKIQATPPPALTTTQRTPPPPTTIIPTPATTAM